MESKTLANSTKTSSPLIPVYNLKMAQELLKLNYTIKDMRINKKDPTKLKFLFVRDDTIEQIIQELSNKYKSEHKNSK